MTLYSKMERIGNEMIVAYKAFTYEDRKELKILRHNSQCSAQDLKGYFSNRQICLVHSQSS